jgi:hypothetical protein
MRTILTAVMFAAVLLLGCGRKTSDTGVKIDSAADKPIANIGASRGGKKTAANTESAKDEGPLLLEDEPLLLLEGDGPLLLDNTDSAATEGADNSRCHVCHINYTQDSLAITHAKADMGCATCHGESDEHIADESWASGGNGTAPDKMYPKDKVIPFCLGCHKAETLPVTEHEVVLVGDTIKVCTDCHGNHRLPKRRCKWK